MSDVKEGSLNKLLPGRKEKSIHGGIKERVQCTGRICPGPEAALPNGNVSDGYIKLSGVTAQMVRVSVFPHPYPKLHRMRLILHPGPW